MPLTTNIDLSYCKQLACGKILTVIYCKDKQKLEIIARYGSVCIDVSAHVNPRQPLYILDDAVLGEEVEWVGQLLDFGSRHRGFSHLALPARLFNLAANVKVNMVSAHSQT